MIISPTGSAIVGRGPAAMQAGRFDKARLRPKGRAAGLSQMDGARIRNPEIGHCHALRGLPPSHQGAAG